MPHKMNATVFGQAVKCHEAYSVVTNITRRGGWDKPWKHCFISGIIPTCLNILYNMFITTFGIRMPFNGWDAYVFLHISIRALKKQQAVFLLKVAHWNMVAADLSVLWQTYGSLRRSALGLLIAKTDLSPCKQVHIRRWKLTSDLIPTFYNHFHTVPKQCE